MTSAAPLAALADFPDRLSPMVVKELRQGLRTRMFRSVLLVAHLLLIGITLLSGAARNPDEVRWMLDGLTTLALCVVLPLCGFSALATEIKAKTLETLVLTRLSAARIVFGKWASLALQSLLLACSLMPYFVARYVYGGADLLNELASLGGQWLVGIVIAAGIVCLSTQRQFWLRAVVVAMLMMGPGLVRIIYLMFSSISRSAGVRASFPLSGLGAAWPAWVVVCPSIVAAAWTIFFFLSLAATRIAPAASHLAVVKRLVHAVTVFALLLVAFWQTAVTEELLFVAATVISLASFDALVEVRNEVPSLLIPFYRRGFLGRMAAWVLTPGWPNGVFYSLALTLLVAGAALALETLQLASRIWFAVAGVWLSGLLLHLSSARRWRDMLTPFIGIFVFVSLIQTLVLMISTNPLLGRKAVWVGLVFPGTVEGTLTMAAANTDVYGDAQWLRIVATLLNSVWPFLLILLALWALRQTREVRTEGRLLAAG
ncbi:MAG TPA: hypothetical protein VD994_13585 [Prosthecobacter sp.]|nr:hypothetical protein [Prosthecobacter sp.]